MFIGWHVITDPNTFIILFYMCTEPWFYFNKHLSYFKTEIVLSLKCLGICVGGLSTSDLHFYAHSRGFLTNKMSHPELYRSIIMKYFTLFIKYLSHINTIILWNLMGLESKVILILGRFYH